MTFPLTLFCLVSACLSLILFTIGGFVVTNSEVKSSNEPFECGFEASKTSRFPFSVHYFLVGVLFVIFDMELVICLPMINMLSGSWWFWTWGLILFILMFGYLLEVVMGSLDWKN